MNKPSLCSAVCCPPLSNSPKPRELRDPLLLVLGQQTGFAPGIFVEMAPVVEAVIAEAGFDPQNLPATWGQGRRSRTNGGAGAGIDRNVQLAFRYGYRDNQPPLTLRGPRPGLWGLTEAGVAIARTLAPKPIPQPRTFAEPLLRGLGKLTGHTLNPVPRQDAMDACLREAGYDPKNLPRGWRDQSSNSQPKIHESLRWVARSISTLVTFPARGYWALTPLGLEKAAQYNGVVLAPMALTPPVRKTPTGPNATSQWFTKHLRPAPGGKDSELMTLMRGALLKHLPLSARRGLIEDHIQNFMVRVIRRDSFAAVLSAGGEIPYSKVASYCVNSGRSDARDMGTEPVCRELMGARTNWERQNLPNEDVTCSDLGLGARRDTDGNLAVLPEEPDGRHPGAAGDFDTLWKQIENIVQDGKPGAWERYSNLLLLKAQGFSTQEIAEKEGVSRHRAARMLATVRQMVREACPAPDLAWAT